LVETNLGSKKMQIAVLIPLYKDSITADEQISLRQLDYFLSAYQRIVVKPASLKKTLPGCKIVDFSDHHFSSIAAYSKLLLSPFFYETFSSFEYILIYQLDCLVFSDNLVQWCKEGYDYIGSPLFQKNSVRPKFSRVGNGGFSLRKVKSFLKVLNSKRYIDEHVSFWKEFLFTHIPDLGEWVPSQRWQKKIKILRQARKGVEWYAGNYTLNEDLFWSDRARLFDLNFKIAPLEDALRFSFERNPRICFEKNNHQIPFGCHAWTKWDRAFYETYMMEKIN
jgi:hypothetical protein